jgi:uncharacterized protein YciI
MKVGEKYFVRIDEKTTSSPPDDATRAAHFEYLKKLSTLTTLFGGGFDNIPGGMIIFTAENIHDAKSKCEIDPVISKGFYSYRLYEWTVQLTSG